MRGSKDRRTKSNEGVRQGEGDGRGMRKVKEE